MARISYDGDHRGLLMRTLAGYLTRAIEEFPVDPRSIYEMVVVGNSTMRDLFFGLDVQSIGQRPYKSQIELEYRAREAKTTSLTVHRPAVPAAHPPKRGSTARLLSADTWVRMRRLHAGGGYCTKTA
jgi:hypothetical protein